MWPARYVFVFCFGNVRTTCRALGQGRKSLNAPQAPQGGINTWQVIDFLNFFIKIIKNIKNMMFSIFFAPWQETFADAGDGDGEGGDHFGSSHFGSSIQHKLKLI